MNSCLGLYRACSMRSAFGVANQYGVCLCKSKREVGEVIESNIFPASGHGVKFESDFSPWGGVWIERGVYLNPVSKRCQKKVPFLNLTWIQILFPPPSWFETRLGSNWVPSLKLDSNTTTPTVWIQTRFKLGTVVCTLVGRYTLPLDASCFWNLGFLFYKQH